MPFFVTIPFTMKCSSLASVTIPLSATWNEGGAFMNCSSLEYITIPDSATYIGPDAFLAQGLVAKSTTAKVPTDLEDMEQEPRRLPSFSQLLASFSNSPASGSASPQPMCHQRAEL